MKTVYININNYPKSSIIFAKTGKKLWCKKSLIIDFSRVSFRFKFLQVRRGLQLEALWHKSTKALRAAIFYLKIEEIMHKKIKYLTPQESLKYITARLFLSKLDCWVLQNFPNLPVEDDLYKIILSKVKAGGVVIFVNANLPEFMKYLEQDGEINIFEEEL